MLLNLSLLLNFYFLNTKYEQYLCEWKYMFMKKFNEWNQTHYNYYDNNNNTNITIIEFKLNVLSVW